MGIFARYVFRQAGGALLLILLSLSGVVWIALALKQLNLITSEGQDAWTFVLMTTLALPNLMAIIAPIALLIAVIHTLNRLNGDSELIVLTASGANPLTVLKPVLALGLVVAIAVGIVNHFAMPWSLRKLRDFIIESRANLITQVLQPGRFNSPERGLTFHIRERSIDGQLYGLLMQDQRDPNVAITYLADQGAIVKQDGRSFLLMKQGHVLRKTDPAEPAQVIVFQSYAVNLDRFEPKGEHTELKPRERYFDELAYPDPEDPDFKFQPGQFRAELHERFASPLYPIVFVLIAYGFVGMARSTRQNRNETAVYAFAIATVLRLVGFAANNLVVLNASFVPVLYGVPLVSGVAALIFIRINARPSRGPSLGDRMASLGDVIRAPFARARVVKT